MDALRCTKFDVVLMCLSLCCFLSCWAVFALCLRCLRCFYNLFCVVVDSVVVVSVCLKCCSRLSRLLTLCSSYACRSVCFGFSSAVWIGLGCIWLLFSGLGCVMLFYLI